jgi:hypothetical protein
MHTKEYEAEYTYNNDLDIVNIEIDDEYVHEQTIELEFGVFLDFDENYMPVNLEIISASKVIGIEKELLMNPDGKVTIIIGDEVIKVEAIFKFKNENETIKFKSLNEFGFPNSQTDFTLV